ncbi:MAG: hypothetical protein ACI9KK_002485 [Ascidiaceihabitans sp.]|jgi:hypothetical protein
MYYDALLRVCVLSASLTVSFAGGLFAQTVPIDCNAQDQAAMDGWFPHTQTPAPTAKLTSDSNCAFHVSSTQMFLWLTQTDPATGQMRLLGMHTIDELFAPDGQAKIARSKAPLQLRPRVSKSNEADLAAIHQAGSNGVLVDHNGRVIYYEQLFNPPYVDFVRSKFFSNGAFDPALMAAATGVDDFFPTGLMEIKTSWMVVDGDDVGNFLTVPAEIFLLKNENSEIVVSTETQPATVALVGMHLAGRVDDHPEMIWATFEHIGNAPNLPADVAHDGPQAVSADSFTFYSGGTAAAVGNNDAAGSLTLDETTQVLDPITQVFRQFTYGTPNEAIDGALNVANIETINAFYQTKFTPAGDPTQHYFEVGASWMLPNTLQPDMTPMAELRGSTMLSNSTMETFTQNDQQCFSCHNSLPQFEKVSGQLVELPGTNFNISHALTQEYFRTLATQQGMSIKALR